MDYGQIAALFDYWKNHPPTHILFQGLMKSLGVSKDAAPADSTSGQPAELSEEGFNELAQNLGFS